MGSRFRDVGVPETFSPLLRNLMQVSLSHQSKASKSSQIRQGFSLPLPCASPVLRGEANREVRKRFTLRNVQKGYEGRRGFDPASASAIVEQIEHCATARRAASAHTERACAPHAA